MDYVNVWMYACASVVTMMVGWKTLKLLGWKKNLMFFLTRGLAKEKGVMQGLAIWPAFTIDIVLLPIYAFCSLSKGTIEKQLEKIDSSALEINRNYWSGNAIRWLQKDFNLLREDVKELVDVWAADESVIDLEHKMKELEMEITRVSRNLSRYVENDNSTPLSKRGLDVEHDNSIPPLKGFKREKFFQTALDQMPQMPYC